MPTDRGPAIPGTGGTTEIRPNELSRATAQSETENRTTQICRTYRDTLIALNQNPQLEELLVSEAVDGQLDCKLFLGPVVTNTGRVKSSLIRR